MKTIIIDTSYFVKVRPYDPVYQLALFKLVQRNNNGLWPSELIWTTAYGAKYRLKEMSDSHVINARRRLEDPVQEFPKYWGGVSKENWLIAFTAELIKRKLI